MFRSIQDKSHTYGLYWGRYLVIAMAVLLLGFSTVSKAHAQAPEIEVQGSNSQVISTPDTTPSTADGTDFGSQGVGISRNELFFVINQGNADLIVSSPVISGADAGDFRIISNLTSPVSASSQTDFALEFTPSTAGLKQATITLTTNDADEGTFRFDVQGTGSVVPGSFTAASANIQSTAINAAYAQPLVVTLLDTNNDAISSASIQFVSDGNAANPSVTFPNGNNTFTTVTDANGQASVSVTANGVAGAHTVTATTAGIAQVDFSLTNTVAAADTTPPRIASIVRQNPTTETTDADSLTWRVTFDEAVQNVNGAMGGDFVIAGVANADVTVNSVSASVYDVILSGGDLPNLNGTVTLSINSGTDITDFAGNALMNFAPTGINENAFNLTNSFGPQPELVIRTLARTLTTPDRTPTRAKGTDYGSVELGDSLDLTLIIQNTGTADLTFSSPIISGPDSADFTVRVDPASPITAGSQNNFVVRFTPSRLGAHNVTFSFTNNDSDESPFIIDLTGTGVNEPPRISSIDQIIGTSPTDADEVIWRIIFSEQGIQNLTADDFQVSGTTATLSVRTPPTDNIGSQFGTLLDLRLSGGDLAGLNGNVTLSLSPGHNIIDSDNDPLTNSMPTGLDESTVQIINNEPDIRVTGNGTSANPTGGPDLVNGQTVTSAADGTDFSIQQVGTDSDRFRYGVGNISPFSTLSILDSNVQITGPNAGDFRFSPSLGSRNLPGNSSTGFVVRFRPTAVGVRQATISIGSNDPDESPFTFNISGTGVVGAPSSLVATSGSGQSAMISSAFNAVLIATVTDSGGNPVPGENVTFTAPASGASGTFSGGGVSETVTTDASGVATSTTFTADGDTGTYDIVASATGLTSVNFTLTNNQGPPEIEVFRGVTEIQTGDTVALGDVTAISGGLTIRNAGTGPLTLGEAIIVSPTHPEDLRLIQPGTASVIPGESTLLGYRVIPVTSGGPDRSFTLSIPNNDADENPFLQSFTYASIASGNIAAASGDGQTAPINTAFVNAIVARVENRVGERVSGVTVNFTAPGSGASAALSAPSAITDANGEARVTATANMIIGTYDVTASVAGLGTVAFTLSNDEVVAATLTATLGGGQNTAISTAFNDVLVATVIDTSGNPVPGERVTFTAPASGPSGTFSSGGVSETVTTDAAGAATSSRFTANGEIGNFTVTAMSGSLNSVTYALTNQPGAAATLVATSGGGQSAAISTAFSNVLIATVTDVGGNPVSGERVTFTAPASGASGGFSGGGISETVTTDASGVATSSILTANNTVGSYAVTATSGALSSVAFSLTNEDNTSPTVTISDVPNLITGAFTARFTFSEDVTGFAAADISVVNGSVSELNGNGSEYTALIGPDGQGDISVSLAANVVTDLAGNGNIASGVQTAILDDSAPEVEITLPDSASTSDADNPFTATFTFTEPVTNFELGDIGIEGGALSNFTAQPGGRIFTVSVTPSLNQEGATDGTTLKLSIEAGSFTDVAGNTNTEAKIASVRIDTKGPIVTLSVPPSETTVDFMLTASFSEDVINFEASDIKVTNGTIEVFTELTADEYQFMVKPAELGAVTVTISANVAEDSSGNGNQALANPAVTEFKLDSEVVRIRTEAIANNFIAGRADQLTAADPNLSARLQNQGAGKGFDGRLNGSGNLKLVNLSFDGGASGEALNLNRLVGADHAGRIASWVQATLAVVDSEDGSETDQLFIHAGVDYRVSDDLLVGVLGQYDHSKQSRSQTISSDGFEVSGDGFLVGPYTVVRLKDGLVFDGRVAWGKSDNEISPYNTYVDEFETTRWLLKGQLTGQLNLKGETSGWTISPELALLYYTERQSAYTDSNGIVIGEQDIELGRLSFGPRISHTIQLENENKESLRALSSTFSLRGIWDFETPDLADLTTGMMTGSDQFRARGQGGLTYTLESGSRFTVEGFYDGIGANSFNAYGGSISFGMTY